jgi:agmatinase
LAIASRRDADDFRGAAQKEFSSMIRLERLTTPSEPPRPVPELDDSAPALDDGGLYGLGLPIEHARLVAVPVPYDVTCSKRHGTIDGPRALIEASAQVDLFDPVVEDAWRAGICALPESASIRRLSEQQLPFADRARAGDRAAHQQVEQAGRAVWDWLDATCSALLDAQRIPLVLGGEHGISFGAFRAAARRVPSLSLLQIDAHADLRAAYEGWSCSHASVMARALELEPLDRLVQVGLRDLSREEQRAMLASHGRVRWFTDHELGRRQLQGERWSEIVDEIIASLGPTVWISFDIDGLDPALCPGTGTPVPGGLSWRETALLCERLSQSGKRIVGVDLVEVGASDWDGYVAAKLLYVLAGISASE